MVGAPYATVDGRSRAALASGDFNGDECADLAVGVPDQVFGARRPGAEGHGAVRVFLGTPYGLRADRLLTVRDVGRPYGTDRFGAALVAADLDDDGDDELVVGAPGLAGGGGVAVFGVKGRGLLVTQRTRWVGQTAGETDGFGSVLAAGDFDGRGGAELAVGAPGDGPKGEGAVTVLDPLRRTAGYIAQGQPGISGARERLDNFGAALAAGDFDRDGRDELAIGTPSEDGGGSASVGDSQGAVQVVDGVTLRQVGRIWSGRGAKGRYDRYGAALATGDLTGDGIDDLAVGAPGRGAVTVLPGSRGNGITGKRTRTIRSPLGAHAQFGWSLTAQKNGLLIGAPGATGFGGAITLLSPGARSVMVLRVPVRGLLGYSLA